MKREIAYKVKTTIKSNTINEEELIDIFNNKLLRLIISFENSRVPNECQVCE